MSLLDPDGRRSSLRTPSPRSTTVVDHDSLAREASGAPGAASSCPHTRAVVLTGVGPIFGRGLSDALGRAGAPTMLVRDPQDVAALVADASARLVVAPVDAFSQVHESLADHVAAGLRTAVLVDDESPEHYRHARREGAHAVVSVTLRPPLMVAALMAALRGYSLLPSATARSLCRSIMHTRDVDLAPRELSWLRHIAAGVTVADLAQRSSYSEREMYRLLRAAYRRLGATHRSEALIAAQRAGLLAPQEA